MGLNWDQVMEMEDQGTDLIDKGLGKVDFSTKDLDLVDPPEDSLEDLGPIGEYPGLADEDIVKKILKDKSLAADRQRRSKLSNFKVRFDKELVWVPKESLLSHSISEDRRYREWVVRGLILIRDDGRCRVCGERVRGNTWKMLKEDKRGRVEESNCFLVCKDCGLCHTYKEFHGESRVEKFQRMKLFVLKRRYKGVGNCGRLKETGTTIMVRLERDFMGGSVTDARLLLREIKRISKEKGVFG